MSNKKVLIVGGAGFIGINTAAKFLREGWQVTILDNLSRQGTDLNLDWLTKEYQGMFKFIKADIVTDQKILESEVSTHEAVIHLAAQVAVTTSVVNPRHDFEVNTLGTFNVLEAIRKSSKRPFLLYSSTNKVYGDLEELKIQEGQTRYLLSEWPEGVSEKQTLDFHSPYGCSKGAADQYVHDYARIYNLSTVVLRQSCIYGPHQFGIEDQGWIAWFIIACLLEKKVNIYGDGKQVRDALFVGDLVDLYFKAVNSVATVSGKVYNIGGGKNNSLSLLEFLNKLNESFAIKVDYSFAPARPGDQKVFISNNDKVRQELGWVPQTNLNQGLRLVIDWLKNNRDIIKKFY